MPSQRRDLGAVSGAVAFARTLGGTLGIAAASALVLGLLAGALGHGGIVGDIEDLARQSLPPELQSRRGPGLRRHVRRLRRGAGHRRRHLRSGGGSRARRASAGRRRSMPRFPPRPRPCRQPSPLWRKLRAARRGLYVPLGDLLPHPQRLGQISGRPLSHHRGLLRPLSRPLPDLPGDLPAAPWPAPLRHQPARRACAQGLPPLHRLHLLFPRHPDHRPHHRGRGLLRRAALRHRAFRARCWARRSACGAGPPWSSASWARWSSSAPARR